VKSLEPGPGKADEMSNDRMGEVRVKATLTNSVDAALARRGQLAIERVRRFEADAMVDTGAVQSVIPSDIASQLGVQVHTQRIAEYADGRRELVGVTEPMLVTVQGRITAEEALILGDEVIIGQTILEKLDLVVDSANRLVVPNPAHPDQLITKVKPMGGGEPASVLNSNFPFTI
jgi:clan AA aspartic protease